MYKRQVADLVAYRKKNEKMVHRIADVALPSKYGSFRAIGYENDLDDLCHVAAVSYTHLYAGFWQY